ncbi:hypothetical protein HYH03_012677 [Edaphochlamys debaryana]|uniref:SRCR domain-containing protein n=1 Tax=Edaphochlamys debaryana TaxID=47281 RepID=A0A835XRG3_9CHLO|nr:hypothetical protein HYH03_012677 [Edaphochlamys debaryana]|eukprot:KAG2488883.1 hypothetical protein HYH03_012677 [Edaphochlamys debaryana]
MVASEGELLPASVLRQIGDKLYDRRKSAALEVEQLIKRLAAQNDQHRIRLIIDKLISEYAFSSQPNHRKGALLCLAASAVGLGDPTEVHLRQIVPPVLASFTDQDARVRYYACEALYNIAKVARGTFILFFNEVFDAMFRLCADSEPNVQNAVQFLDALIKDIAADCTHWDVAAFIPKLRDYLRVTNPHKRSFLLSWVVVLDSLPHVRMLRHLPALLDGLLSMLAEPVREVRTQAANCLKDFLSEVRSSPPAELAPDFFPRLTATLVERAGSPDELTRLTAIHWLRAFVELAPQRVLGHVPAILGVVLYNISSHNADIQRECAEANAALLRLEVGAFTQAQAAAQAQGQGQAGAPSPPSMDMGAILATVILELRSEMEATRLEALRWLHFLLASAQALVLEEVGRLLPPLLDSLSAPSDAVVTSALGVLAALADCPGQFTPVLVAFLGRFRGEAGLALLQRSGSSLVRRLCCHLGAGAVLTELGAILQRDSDMGFAATMVSVLNLILLTGPELAELRDQLRRAAVDPAGAQLFATLYPSWCYSAGALLSLCFVAQAYEHAEAIVHAFADLPFGAELLVQIDRLVALLETPCFTFLRLQLLEPRRHPALLRALYGLLMLLPQCNAFRMLNTRLQAVPTLELLQLGGLARPQGLGQAQAEAEALDAPGAAWADWGALLAVFKKAQLQQYEAYVAQRQPPPLVPVGTAGPGVAFAAGPADRPTTTTTADTSGVPYLYNTGPVVRRVQGAEGAAAEPGPADAASAAAAAADTAEPEQAAAVVSGLEGSRPGASEGEGDGAANPFLVDSTPPSVSASASAATLPGTSAGPTAEGVGAGTSQAAGGTGGFGDLLWDGSRPASISGAGAGAGGVGGSSGAGGLAQAGAGSFPDLLDGLSLEPPAAGGQAVAGRQLEHASSGGSTPPTPAPLLDIYDLGIYVSWRSPSDNTWHSQPWYDDPYDDAPLPPNAGVLGPNNVDRVPPTNSESLTFPGDGPQPEATTYHVCAIADLDALSADKHMRYRAMLRVLRQGRGVQTNQTVVQNLTDATDWALLVGDKWGCRKGSPGYVGSYAYTTSPHRRSKEPWLAFKLGWEAMPEPLQVRLALPLTAPSGQPVLMGADPGRVWVYHNGTWGTVCLPSSLDSRCMVGMAPTPFSLLVLPVLSRINDGWSRMATVALCRQLGYGKGRIWALETSQAYSVGGASGPIWLDNVDCPVGSTSLTANCSFAPLGDNDCTHDEDVQVTCVGLDTMESTPGVTYPPPHEGDVDQHPPPPPREPLPAGAPPPQELAAEPVAFPPEQPAPPPSPPAPPPAPSRPPWSHSCSLLLSSDKAAGPPSLACVAAEGAQAPLTVAVGAALLPRLQVLTPATVRLVQRKSVVPYARYKDEKLTQPVDDLDPGSDIGITFRGVPHLRLVDSLVAGQALSPGGPLVQCLGCAHLTLHNVTLRELKGYPLLSDSEIRRFRYRGGPSYYVDGRPRGFPSLSEDDQWGGYGPSRLTHGPLHATNLTSVSMEGVTCADVTLAMGWACALLQYGTAPRLSLSINGSLFQGTEVMWRGAYGTWSAAAEGELGYISTEGHDTVWSGFGAVVVDARRSLALDSGSAKQRARGGLAPAPGGYSAVNVSASNSTWRDVVGGSGFALSILKPPAPNTWKPYWSPHPAWAHGSLRLADVSIVNASNGVGHNHASFLPGAVLVQGSLEELELSRTQLRDNKECAVLVRGGLRNITVADSSVVGNTAGYLSPSSFLRLRDNSAVRGTIAIRGGPDPFFEAEWPVIESIAFEDCLIHNNTRQRSGDEEIRDPNAGGVLGTTLQITNLALSGCKISDNSAAEGSGGFLAARSITSATFTRVTFTNNTAARDGGILAVRMSLQSLALDSVRVANCSAAFRGGAFAAGRQLGHVQASASSFEACSAGVAGGVLAAGDEGVLGITLHGGTQVVDCTAGRHGGFAYIAGSLGSDGLELTGGSVISGASARRAGGALMVMGSVEGGVSVSGNSSMVGCQAPRGAVLSCEEDFVGSLTVEGGSVLEGAASTEEAAQGGLFWVGGALVGKVEWAGGEAPGGFCSLAPACGQPQQPPATPPPSSQR